LAAVLIFLATYLVLAIGRFPGFRVDRTGVCIIGASRLALAMSTTLAGNLTMLGSGESDRSPESAPRSADRLLGVFPGRRAVDRRDHHRRGRLAELRRMLQLKEEKTFLTRI